MDTIQVIEIVAATIGILYVVLEVRASFWLWPVGIILPFFYMYISWEGQMYGNILVNLYYLIAAIWGWRVWHKRRHEKPEADHITYAPRKARLVLLLCTALGITLLTPLFDKFMESPYPLGDVTATVISAVGMWLLAKKYIENWYCWIISNAIFCILFFLQGFTITGIFYFIYTSVAVVGYFSWKKQLHSTGNAQ